MCVWVWPGEMIGDLGVSMGAGNSLSESLRMTLRSFGWGGWTTLSMALATEAQHATRGMHVEPQDAAGAHGGWVIRAARNQADRTGDDGWP